MKKVLALALAIVMVLSLGVTATATTAPAFAISGNLAPGGTVVVSLATPLTVAERQAATSALSAVGFGPAVESTQVSATSAGLTISLRISNDLTESAVARFGTDLLATIEYIWDESPLFDDGGALIGLSLIEPGAAFATAVDNFVEAAFDNFEPYVPSTAEVVSAGTAAAPRQTHTVNNAAINAGFVTITVPGATGTGDINFDDSVGASLEGVTVTRVRVVAANSVRIDFDASGRPAGQGAGPHVVQIGNPTYEQLNFPPVPPTPRDPAVPTGYRITGMDETAVSNVLRSLQGAAVSGNANFDTLRLTPDMFYWRGPAASAHDHRVVGAPAGFGELRSSHLSAVRVDARVVSGHRDMFRDLRVDVNNGDVRLRTRTAEFMNRFGANEMTIEFTVRVGSYRVTERVDVTVQNTGVFVGGTDGFVAPSKTEYIEADDVARNLEIYAGAGVTFFRNMSSGARIYVQADLATHEEAEEIFRQFPDVVDIIDIHHRGMAVAGVRVEIEGRSENFVYDGDFNFLGTTASTNLPFATRYILTNARINWGELAGVEEPAYEGFEPAVPGGGAPAAEVNVNFNPGTGR